jgi:hypothetical protein
MDEGFLRLIVVLCVSLIAFFTVIWLFGFNPAERLYLSGLIQQLKNKIKK